MTNEAKNELTYQIILDAINGNSEAEELIFYILRALYY